jgi:hypothetical protein
VAETKEPTPSRLKEAQKMSTMKLNRIIAVAALLAIQAGLSGAEAQSQDVDVKALLRRIEELEQKVRILERKRELDVKEKDKPVEELDQQVKIPEHKREVESETAGEKLKEGRSLFKMPDWLTSVKLINDLRLRYDGIYAPDPDFVTRQRVRPRLRLGGMATLKDDFEIGFRLASTPSVGKDSGGDPLSTNQTLEDNGSRKPVGVDWVFARWTPIHTPRWTGSFTAGKMENPPNYSENVFDVDYTPEGFAEQFSYRPHANHTVGTYLGQYFLDEIALSGKDPFLFLEQLRLDSKWTRHVSSSFGVSGLSITSPENLTTASVPDSNHGNTRTAAGVLVNDYQLLIADGSITWNLDSFPLYQGPFPIKLAGEFIQNFGASRDHIGYAFGPSFGRVSQTGKVQKGNWEVSYRYHELPGDANYEELTASDNGTFYRHRPVGEPGSGSFRPTFLNGLNLRGHAFRVAYAPFDSLVLDARVWLNQAIREVDAPEGVRVLVDLVWKF